MEIITSYSKAEFEEIIADTVKKCITKVLTPPAQEPPDLIDIDEACRVTGYSKATIYKKSFKNELPCSRRGKRLVFSRRALLAWMEAQTIPKPTAADRAAEHLARVAREKRN